MTTAEKIKPALKKIYRFKNSEYSNAFVEDVAKVIDTYEDKPRRRDLEDLLTLRIWDWQSGGSTASYAAKKVLTALVPIRVGQTYDDTLVNGGWPVKVVKLNKKSARVEVELGDGSPYQYRMEYTFFYNGRMELVEDVLDRSV